MYQCKKALVSWLAVFVGDVEGIIQKTSLLQVIKFIMKNKGEKM